MRAAGGPDHARSALDAVNIANTGANHLREHVTDAGLQKAGGTNLESRAGYSAVRPVCGFVSVSRHTGPRVDGHCVGYWLMVPRRPTMPKGRSQERLVGSAVEHTVHIGGVSGPSRAATLKGELRGGYVNRRDRFLRSGRAPMDSGLDPL